LLICTTPTDASAQTWDFPNDSQGWHYLGLYDDNGLTPIGNLVDWANPWTGTEGDGGAIVVGWEGFAPHSPTNSGVIHADLNSPKLAYMVGRSFGLRYDITGADMVSTARVWVQAVLLLRRPTDITDRRVPSGFHPVPIGEDGAWETHTFAPRLPAGTIIKQINLRIFFEPGSPYNGHIFVDNVEMR
jgi:hypothetical protein